MAKKNYSDMLKKNYSDMLKKIVSVRVIFGLSKSPTHNYWLMKGLRYVPYCSISSTVFSPPLLPI